MNPRPRTCRCPGKPNSKPQKPSVCVKCGYPFSPHKEKDGTPTADLIYHCARCTCDLHPGFTGGALYHLEGGKALSMIRFCSDCLPIVTEMAVSHRPVEPV